jgi:3-oxoacyl-[acyl-carrier protein] reductase
MIADAAVPYRFSGRRVLVAGGSCRLALCLADRLIAASLFPILTYRSEAGAKRIADFLNGKEDRYRTVYFDLGRGETLADMLAEIQNDLDYVVDFAQGDLESFIAAADEARIGAFFLENVVGRAGLLKQVSRIMMRQKFGRLVYISSTAALRPNPGQGFYAAAKLASEALYRNLGLELAPRGITAITLRPGYVDAGRGEAFLQDAGKEILGKIPVRRALNSEEIADTILFLLSDGAAGFNAAELCLDGGLTAGK